MGCIPPVFHLYSITKQTNGMAVSVHGFLMKLLMVSNLTGIFILTSSCSSAAFHLLFGGMVFLRIPTISSLSVIVTSVA